MNRRSVLLLLATLVALIGTALVVVYVRSADNRAQEQFDTVEVLRATQTIEAGESIEAATSAGKIASQAVPKNQVLDGAMQSVDSLTGEVAVTNIYAGEQILPAKFGGAAEGQALAIPEGMQAISVELTNAARVSGFVNPGSEVAIYHIEPMSDGSSPTGGGAGPTGVVRMLLKRVLVLGVGSTSTTTTKTTTADGAATTEEVPRTLLTVAVDQADAQRLMFASADSNGTLAFALLSDKSKTQADRGIGWPNLYK
jgi:pilus assembly protein CpaB